MSPSIEPELRTPLFYDHPGNMFDRQLFATCGYDKRRLVSGTSVTFGISMQVPPLRIGETYNSSLHRSRNVVFEVTQIENAPEGLIAVGFLVPDLSMLIHLPDVQMVPDLFRYLDGHMPIGDVDYERQILSLEADLSACLSRERKLKIEMAAMTRPVPTRKRTGKRAIDLT